VRERWTCATDPSWTLFAVSCLIVVLCRWEKDEGCTIDGPGPWPPRGWLIMSPQLNQHWIQLTNCVVSPHTEWLNAWDFGFGTLHFVENHTVNLSVGYLCLFNRKAKRGSSFVSVRTRPACTCKFKSKYYSGDNLWLNVDQFTFGGRKVTSYVLPDIVEARCSTLSVD